MRCVAVLLVISLGGCKSISSTPLNRHDNDSYTRNVDPTRERMQARPFKGIPITLKVPTHLEVSIVETYYIYNNAKSDEPVSLTEFGSSPGNRNLSVSANIVETNKVFTVDFKRPASGSLSYNATLGEDQYFDSITNTIVDTTITDVTNAITSIAPLLGVGTSAAPEFVGDQIKDNVIVANRVVAFQRFDINACDFEEQVRIFLDQHLNACAPNCGYNVSTVGHVDHQQRSEFHQPERAQPGN